MGRCYTKLCKAVDNNEGFHELHHSINQLRLYGIRSTSEVHIHVGFGYLDLWTTVNTATPVEDLSITKRLDLPPQTSTCLLPETRLSLVGLLEALLLVLREALVP